MIDDENMKEKELLLAENEATLKFNYEINPKEILLLMATVLTQPSHIILKSKEMMCEEGHKLKVISIFSLDEKICPIHNVPFLEKSKGTSESHEYITFKVKQGVDEITCFSENNKELLSKLDIYDKVNIKGIQLTIKTSNQSIYTKGVMISEIELYEDKAVQRTLLNKEMAIKKFMSNMPKLNYDDATWDAYKHSLMLSMVYTGINILVIGEPATFKTIFGYSIKNICDGAYMDIPKGTKTGLLGMASKDISGKYHLEGGQIFLAKNNVLVLDEIEKFDDYSYLYPLNEVIANHRLTYNKADIKYENANFNISLLAFGNPSKTLFSNDRPIAKQIEDTFIRNKEFLSRMHLIWGLRNVGFDVSALMDTSKERDAQMEQELAVFIAQAKKIKIKETNISEEAKNEQKDYIEKRYMFTKDLRFAKKFKDMCIAEAKLNMRDNITLSDVKEIENIISIQDKLLWG
ncbi:MAG: hypothetical protein QXH07_04640 [Thermoplasmata archaeon]